MRQRFRPSDAVEELSCDLAISVIDKIYHAFVILDDDFRRESACTIVPLRFFSTSLPHLSRRYSSPSDKLAETTPEDLE